MSYSMRRLARTLCPTIPHCGFARHKSSLLAAPTLINHSQSRLPPFFAAVGGDKDVRLPYSRPQFSREQRDLLLRSLEYEIKRSLPNSEGKGPQGKGVIYFSDFAQGQFELLSQASISPEDQLKFRMLAKDIRKYSGLGFDQRWEVIQRASSALNASFSKPVDPSVAPPSSAAQSAERRASHHQASTSAASLQRPSGSSTLMRSPGPSAISSKSAPAADTSASPEAPLESSSRVEQVDMRAGSQSLGAAIGEQNSTVAEEQASSGDGAVLVGTPSIIEAPKITVEETKQLFQVAAMQWAQRGGVQQQLQRVEQRSQEWHRLRDTRLTASAFGNALGFWGTDRVGELLLEKVGIGLKFRGNAATAWGNKTEDEAAQRYKEVAWQQVESCGFKIMDDGSSIITDWLGASPDGLIPESHPPGKPRNYPFTDVPRAEGPGVLEIKCPYNEWKGGPTAARVEGSPKWWYMPQVQGLMHIFDREWCNLFSYTVNGAAVYHIKRDRQYWADIYGVMSEFWWGSVVPAKQALEGFTGPDNLPPIDFARRAELKDPRLAIIKPYLPTESHARTDELINRSKAMATATATNIRFYPPRKDEVLPPLP